MYLLYQTKEKIIEKYKQEKAKRKTFSPNDLYTFIKFYNFELQESDN